MQQLSQQQITIVKLLSEGFNTRSVASIIGYAPGTVKKSISLMLQGYQCKNRAHLVAKMIRLGYIKMQDVGGDGNDGK